MILGDLTVDLGVRVEVWLQILQIRARLGMLMLGVALATHSTIDVVRLNVLVVCNYSWVRLELLVLLSNNLLCLDLHMSLRL